MATRVVNDAITRITQHYGENGHSGVDIGWRSNETENRVFAHSSGTVVAAVDGYDQMLGSDGMLSYGNYIDIDHGNGYMTRYAHLLKGSIQVSVGQRVNENTQIAVIGETGNAYGRHLHFEVHLNGARVNPEPYLSQDFNGNPTPADITYQSHDSRYGWNPNVNVGSTDYAGNFGYDIDAIYLDDFQLRVHDMVTNEWLPWVEDRNDYAGNLGHAIDGVQIRTNSGTVQPMYRVHINGGDWLDWVIDANDTDSGYAGIYGQSIDALQIFLA